MKTRLLTILMMLGVLQSAMAYTLTVVSGENGSTETKWMGVTGSNSETIDINGGTGTYDINEGTSVTIEFSPFDYQKVEAVTFNGTDITTDLTSPYESSYVRTYTFAMTGDATVNVTYRSIYDYINITSTGPGTTYYEAYGSTESLTDGQDGQAEIEDGTDYTITCTPDNGYSILSVVVNDVDMTAQLEDSPTGGDGKVLTLSNVTENKTVVVTYGTPTPEAYARLTEDSTQVLSQGATGIVYAKKLTFYYDTNKGDGDYAVTTFANYGSRGWDGISGEITSVVFDDSFASYAPTSTAYWFYGMTSLTDIQGISNLNTASVTSMSYMFYRCSALTSLDLTGFNTAQVTNMSQMFTYCSSLTTIYAGEGWSTAAVQFSANMFTNCTSLVGSKGTTVTNTGADYARIDGGDSAPGYFSDPNAASSFNIKVTVSGNGSVEAGQTTIGSNSEGEVTVDSGASLILAITPDTGYAIGSVMVDTLNVTSEVIADSTGVSYYTLARVYDEHAVTVTFVNNSPEAYAVLSENNTVLTFYYDTNKDVRNGMSVGPFSRSSECGWYSQVTTIQSVVFDDSFVNCRPTSTSYWFAGATTLNSITGLSNLNTSEVTSMSNMFYNCVSLGSLDLSGFNTDNVTDMSAMFAESHIYSLNISSFNTANVTTMRRMFYNTYMTEFDVHHFNTANVTDMNSMFGLCEDITSLDLSSFNTSKVENMGSMFVTCERLSNLDISSFSTENVTDMSNMFYNCKALGTIDLGHFTTGNVTNMSNMFNHCEGLTMLDLSQFNTANVTNMQGMFSYANALTSVNLSSFNTSKVTDMRNMFVGCSALTTLDLGSFNTESVRDMIGTFQGCSSLTTINVSSLWSTTALTSSSFGRSMFSDCTNLVGGAGTTYDAEHTDYTYAHIDEGETNPGYFTDINAATEYDVLVTVVGNGSVSIGSGTIAGGSEEHITMPAGGTMTLNITPDTGYALGSLMLDTLDVTSQVAADSTGVLTYTLSRIYDTHTVTVTFVNNTPEAYAVLSDDNTVLTFYYDTNKEKRNGMSVGPFNSSSERGWDYNYTLTTVVFDDSFANYTTLTSTAWWFADTRITNIVGLSNLNTSNVTTMNNMFDGSSSLTSLALSLNTSKVENMSAMFQGCNSLESIELGNFDTSNVTDMSNMFLGCSQLVNLSNLSLNTAKVQNMQGMFSGCNALTSVNLNSFNTANVTNMSEMFSSCMALERLDVSNFNTSNVSNMKSMFSECRALTTLDLSSFNTAKVENMNRMLIDCRSLTTIYVSDQWTTSAVNDGAEMFMYSTSLKGGRGTTFDVENVDYTYARIDGGPDSETPGYFTDANATPVLTWTVAGVESLMGSSWNPADETNDMSTADNVNYYLEKKDIYLHVDSLYEFKICANHAWDESYGLNGGADNYVFSVDISGTYSIMFHFNAETKEVGADITKSPILSWTVAGVESLMGSSWNPADESNDMSSTDGVNYYLEKKDIYLQVDSLYEFKVCANHAWDESYGLDGGADNYVFSVDISGTYSIMFHFNAETKDVVTKSPILSWTVAGVTALCGSEWDPSDTSNDMVAIGDGIFQLVKHEVPLQTGVDYEYKVVANHSWDESYGNGVIHGSNQFFNVSVDGMYDITFTFNEGTKDLTVSYDLTSGTLTEAYAILSENNTVLTFYYDKLKDVRGGMGIGTLFYTESDQPWHEYASTITSVVIDDSFAGYTDLTSTALWFYGFTNLTSVEGLNNLSTANVTNMSHMFFNCSSLETLPINNIHDTGKVDNMNYMFSGCSSLTSLDLTSFNTENVTDICHMFENCTNLASLDMSHFNTQKVSNYSYMFSGCSGLTTIYTGSDWTTAYVTDDLMFSGCTSLVGGRGTIYDANYTDGTYARIDMAPNAPGYFTRKDQLMGDANDDGSVTIADAVATVTNILNEATNEYFSQSKADMNGDSEIDIFDVTLIVNAVLAASPAPAYNGGNIAAEDVRLEAQANSLTMGISGSAPYTAFQFDVTLPEGTTLEGVRLANKATNHQLAFQKVGDNTYRVVGLSMTNQQLSAANGRLVQLQLSGNADESNVTMSNVLFVGQPATDATAIREHITDGAADAGAIYDLNGRYVGNDRRQLSKGIYIINHKKVNIK